MDRAGAGVARLRLERLDGEVQRPGADLAEQLRRLAAHFVAADAGTLLARHQIDERPHAV